MARNNLTDLSDLLIGQIEALTSINSGAKEDEPVTKEDKEKAAKQ